MRPGLALRYYRDATADRPLDARRVRLAALHVPAGTSPTPLIAPGPFVARLTGYLKTPAKASCSFRVVGSGITVLTINGTEVLRIPQGDRASKASAPVDLVKGYNRLEILYTSPGKEDACLRVYWTGEGFALEPLPPESLFTRGDTPDLVGGLRLREGRLEFATLGCARCHALPAKRPWLPAPCRRCGNRRPQ